VKTVSAVRHFQNQKRLPPPLSDVLSCALFFYSPLLLSPLDSDCCNADFHNLIPANKTSQLWSHDGCVMRSNLFWSPIQVARGAAREICATLVKSLEKWQSDPNGAEALGAWLCRISPCAPSKPKKKKKFAEHLGWIKDCNSLCSCARWLWAAWYLQKEHTVSIGPAPKSRWTEIYTEGSSANSGFLLIVATRPHHEFFLRLLLLQNKCTNLSVQQRHVVQVYPRVHRRMPVAVAVATCFRPFCLSLETARLFVGRLRGSEVHPNVSIL